jgi:hypothetical protein
MALETGARRTPPFAWKEKAGNAVFSAGRGSACGGTGLALEDPGALSLDLLGTEVVEQTAPWPKSTGTRWISSSSRRPAEERQLARLDLGDRTAQQ